ncbi:XylR family transcriptional regulator [Luteolibacter sp. LG18]|nr:XylR family transcriptional regulator [Luteolibacter sp. LG18]
MSDYFRAGVAEGAAAYGRAHGVEIDPRWFVRGDWMGDHPAWNAVIAEVVNMPTLADRVLALNLPTVLMAPLAQAPAGFPVVTADFRACGALAFEELASLGARSLAVLRTSPRDIDHECCDGFIDAAHAHGRRVIDPEPARKLAETVATAAHFNERVSAFADILEEMPRPVGVFLAHAGLTYSLQMELKRRGFRVPEDYAMVVIQKDVQGTAEMAPVPITTVDPDSWQQGYFAAQLLHDQLRGERPDASVHRIPPAGITRRDSTGCPLVKDPGVAKVVHLIRERFASDLKVDELARLAAVGRRSLEERFRKEMHQSIHEALTRRRMDEARKLLRSTPLGIALVAEACGYSSVHYFTTAFKRETGTSPAAYRAAAGKGRA